MKPEGTDTYSLNCSAHENSASLDVPDYIRNIQELPSFEEENNDSNNDDTNVNTLQSVNIESSRPIAMNSPQQTNTNNNVDSDMDVNLNTTMRCRNEIEVDNTVLSLEEQTATDNIILQENEIALPYETADLNTESDPIFESLFFPEIEPSDTTLNQDNAVKFSNDLPLNTVVGNPSSYTLENQNVTHSNVNQCGPNTVGANQITQAGNDIIEEASPPPVTHTPKVVQELNASAPSLQDIVKTYMLGENYPYPILMDEITRICKLPIMRLQIVKTPLQPTRPCKVVVKKLKQLDLAKLGLITNSVSTDNDSKTTSSSDSESMKSNVDEDYLPDLTVTASRYPKRTVSTVNYDSNSDPTSDEPVTRKRRITPTGLKTPSRSRILSQNMGATKNPVCRPKYITTNKSQDDGSNADNVVENQDNDDISEDNELPVLRDTTTSSINNANRKHRKRGSLNIVHHHRDKPKKSRKFHCEECDVQENSLAELNSHFRNTHGVVTCKTCNKTFTTPSTLTRHSYSHGPQKHACTKKGCNFRSAFASELERHKLVHRTIATHQCQFANCERWYFSKDELNKHVRIHDGKGWDCDEPGCNYSTPDKRLLKQHYRKHSDEKPYECGLCHKSFTYHTQYSRHVRNDTCEA